MHHLYDSLCELKLAVGNKVVVVEAVFFSWEWKTMTTYNYMIEMQEMCFRITQACKVMGKQGTQDLYAACELGLGKMAKELTCEDAGKTISQDQLDMYACVQNFCKDQEREAAAFIKLQEKKAMSNQEA